jgi:WD40 repeat protein/serine/threonine protein kinase/tetratricopeptide (TPR) repeat protein
MPDESVLLGELAEQFSARVRQGQLPNIEEYACAHPVLAARIRELFPTLMLLEGMAGGAAPPSDTPRNPAELAAGQTFGAYRIEREIGRGGMGVVYEAVHLALDKRVALKILPIHGPRQASQLERFLREAKTAAGLHHTNIVPVFDVGQVAGTPYYAMQLIDGQGLDRILLAVQPTSPDQTGPYLPQLGGLPVTGLPRQPDTPITTSWSLIAEIGIQAAGALAYAHQRGVIHRDIKPSNLLLDAQGVVWITDFGLARRLEDPALTHSGVLLGTPRYMSPEQAEAAKRPVDHRTDIYSLGATLYELLTHRPAFDGRTPQEVVDQIIHKDPLPPRRLNPHVPRDLETIILKAMAKRVEDRYRTAAELADDLHRWQRLEPIQARRIGPVGRLARWCRRNPVVASLAAALILLLLIVSTVSTWSAFLIADARDSAKRSADDERLARADVERHVEEVRSLLGQQYVSNGARLMEDGDLSGALVWFVEALQQDHTDPARVAMHRTRINAVLRQCPRPNRFLFLSAPLMSIEYGLGGRRLITNDGGAGMQVWDPATGKAITAPIELLLSHVADALSPKRDRILTYGQLNLFEGSPDGRSKWQQEITVRELETGRVLGVPFKIDNGIGYASFGPDGDRLVVIEHNNQTGSAARVWDVATGRPRTPFLHAANGVRDAKFSPDGRRLLTIGQKARLSGYGSLWVSMYAAGAIGALATIQSPGDALGLGGVLPVLVSWNEPPDARLWDAATGEPIGLPIRHPGGVQGALFSPDGRHLLTWGGKTVQFRDALTGRPLGEPFEAESDVSDAVLSPNGQSVLVVAEGAARVWDLAGSRPVTPLLREAHLREAQFSPDGSRVLTRSTPEGEWEAGWSQVLVWDVATGKLAVPRLIREEGLISQALFSPDGRHILTVKGQTARLWDAGTGEPAAPLFHHNDVIQQAAFSPEGRYLATAGKDHTVRVWDLANSPGPNLALKHSAQLERFALSPDGRWAATTGWGWMQLWDTKTGQPHGPRLEPEWDAGVGQLRFSTDSRRLLTVSGHSDYRPRGALRVWDVASGRPLTPLLKHDDKQPNDLYDASFSPDSARVISFGSTTRVWDAATGRPLFTFAGAAQGFTPDMRRVYTTDRKTARWWDTTTGELTAADEGEIADQVGKLSPDGHRLLAGPVAGDRPDDFQVWDTTTGALLATVRHEHGVNNAHFSPNGDRILTFSAWPGKPGEARLWDAATGRPMTPPMRHELGIREVVFDSDGRRVLSASEDGTARIWDARTGQPLTEPLNHRRAVKRLAFGFDSRKLLWLIGKTGGIARAIFSADGRFVLTVGGEAAQVWDAATGQPVGPALPHHGFGNVDDAMFSPDSRSVLTAAGTTAWLWDLSADQRPIEELVRLAQVIGGHRAVAGASIPPLDSDQFQGVWEEMRARFPEEFGRDTVDMLTWHRREAEEATKTPERHQLIDGAVYGFGKEANEYAALFHLDRLIAAKPGSVELFLWRAHILAESRQWDRAAADLAGAIKNGAKGWEPWRDKGVAHAELGQWKDALQSFERGAAAPDAPFEVHEDRVVLHLFLGDQARYRTACAELWDRYGKTDQALAVVHIATLAQDAVKDFVPLVQRAEKAQTENRCSPVTLAGVLYRAGRLMEAVAVLQQAARDYSPGYSEHVELLLALAHHRLGHVEEARRWLQKTDKGIERFAREALRPDRASEVSWSERVQLSILRREVEAVLKPNP